MEQGWAPRRACVGECVAGSQQPWIRYVAASASLCLCPLYHQRLQVPLQELSSRCRLGRVGTLQQLQQLSLGQKGRILSLVNSGCSDRLSWHGKLNDLTHLECRHEQVLWGCRRPSGALADCCAGDRQRRLSPPVPLGALRHKSRFPATVSSLRGGLKGSYRAHWHMLLLLDHTHAKKL